MLIWVDTRSKRRVFTPRCLVIVKPVLKSVLKASSGVEMLSMKNRIRNIATRQLFCPQKGFARARIYTLFRLRAGKLTPSKQGFISGSPTLRLEMRHLGVFFFVVCLVLFRARAFTECDTILKPERYTNLKREDFTEIAFFFFSSKTSWSYTKRKSL